MFHIHGHYEFQIVINRQDTVKHAYDGQPVKSVIDGRFENHEFTEKTGRAGNAAQRRQEYGQRNSRERKMLSEAAIIRNIFIELFPFGE